MNTPLGFGKILSRAGNNSYSVDTSQAEIDHLVSALRRRLLAGALFLPVGGLLFGCAGNEKSRPPYFRSFLNDHERRFVDAATARLIPDEDSGTGAPTAAVTFFIDRQLAGPYGHAQTWYMQGPWEKGTPEQGYQLAYTPAALYRVAIDNVDAYCRQVFQKQFAELSPSQQDQVLHGLEHGKIKLKDVPAKAFFTLLWQNTQEGFLADPMYGGNRNFTGWALIGFPGPRYNYVDEISLYGKPYAQAPVGLLGRDGKQVLKG
ncbi:gluconate 2-dehydrogenase subunit 3 family protein [Paralcaligenes ginsengisoli]